MRWVVVVLILGLLAVIVYLSLRRQQPEDSADEAEQDEGKERPMVRLALRRRKGRMQFVAGLAEPGPASARPATSRELKDQSLTELEQSLAERERLVTERESRLAELERELAEREALVLAREKLQAEREK